MLVPYETFSIDFLIAPLKLLTFNAFLIAQVKKKSFLLQWIVLYRAEEQNSVRSRSVI